MRRLAKGASLASSNLGARGYRAVSPSALSSSPSSRSPSLISTHSTSSRLSSPRAINRSYNNARTSNLSTSLTMRTKRTNISAPSWTEKSWNVRGVRAYASDAHHDNDHQTDTAQPKQKLYRTYTRAEVAKHAFQDDCWIILNNKVYNISTWADLHPGGHAVLYQFAGSDGTEEWGKIGHSQRARRLMEKYCIGLLADEQKRRYKGLYVEPIVFDEESWEAPEGYQDDVFDEDVSAYRGSR